MKKVKKYIKIEKNVKKQLTLQKIHKIHITTIKLQKIHITSILYTNIKNFYFLSFLGLGFPFPPFFLSNLALVSAKCTLTSSMNLFSN
jgi:hypothetical protein